MKTCSEAIKCRKEAQGRMVNTPVGSKEFNEAKSQFIKATNVLKQFCSEIKEQDGN